MKTRYRYIIKWLDSKSLTTYAEQEQDFVVLPLHGSDVYRIDSKGAREYWKCWQSETGHTADDETDICVLWSEIQQKAALDLIAVGKELGVQTMSPSTWKGVDIDRFFRMQGEEPSEDVKTLVKLPRSIKLKGGKSYIMASLMGDVQIIEPSTKSKEKSTDSETENIPPSAPTPTMMKRQSRNMATPEEIKEAMIIIGGQHRTKGGQANG